MSKMLFIIITTMLFCACASPVTDKLKNSSSFVDSTIVTGATTPAMPDAAYLMLLGDSVEIPRFEIQIALSPKAEQKTVAGKESIVVQAHFSGIPKDTTLDEYRNTGAFFLVETEKELLTTRITIFQSIRFSRAKYDSLAGKDIDLLINVYSGRRSSKDNLLNCEILDKKMSLVKGRRFTLKAPLIYGDD